MKHDLNVTAVIITVFFLTQIVGLFLVNKDISDVRTVDGEIVVEHQDTSIGPRPDTTGFESFLYLAIAVVIGTILVLVIMHFEKVKLWKFWFFMAVLFSISIALGVIMSSPLAFFFAFVLASLKLWKRNVLIHNLTEVLMYSGLAVLLAPIFDLFWVFILLIAISIYDMYAVWRSKHMVKMAQFQAKSELFAGLMIPYEQKKGMKIEIPRSPELQPIKKKVRNAILGGGDVAFPLIFSAVVMENLIMKGVTVTSAFFQAAIISVAVTLAILGLFVFAKKEKFYPAMPVVTLGCVVGYLVVLLL
jgi:presenilin-like A22 family membrane protease